MKTKDKITEDEIIRAIRQVGEDAKIIEAFKSVSEQELREILEKERNSVASRHSQKRVKFWIYTAVSIAAVFLVILMLNVLKTNSSQKIYTAYFEMPEGIVPRSSSEFFDLYNKGQYKTLSVKKTFSKQELEDNELKFYLSVCHMKNEEFQTAIQYLSELHRAVPDRQDVQWYLALCYLKLKEKDKAKELFQNINNEKYADKAKEILKKLK